MKLVYNQPPQPELASSSDQLIIDLLARREFPWLRILQAEQEPPVGIEIDSQESALQLNYGLAAVATGNGATVLDVATNEERTATALSYQDALVEVIRDETTSYPFSLRIAGNGVASEVLQNALRRAQLLAASESLKARRNDYPVDKNPVDDIVRRLMATVVQNQTVTDGMNPAYVTDIFTKPRRAEDELLEPLRYLTSEKSYWLKGQGVDEFRRVEDTIVPLPSVGDMKPFYPHDDRKHLRIILGEGGANSDADTLNPEQSADGVLSETLQAIPQDIKNKLLLNKLPLNKN